MNRDLKDQLRRVDELKNEFDKLFASKADFVVRAPGRVNLIGEHVDYCGYGVFPMAVQQDILIAVQRTPTDTLELNNTDPKYERFSCSTKDFEIHSSPPQWSDYFLCGVRAIQERFPDATVPGLRLLVRATLPAAAGMSSSSALVCAASLATLRSIGGDLPREELAALCAKCERYIGVQGGGMDQAICLLAERDCAKLIEFEPQLSALTVQLPTEAVFVVANSCSESRKGATSHYNTRVVECRLAAQLLLKNSGKEWRKPVRLRDAQTVMRLTLKDSAHLVEQQLHEEPYSKTELSQLFEMTEEEFNECALCEKTKHLTRFNLRSRALHVFQEADRVYGFKNACCTGNLKQMGELMQESHASCKNLYDCSHEQLDRIVAICLRQGALGSRLTGAGWGGCVVTLTTSDKVSSIVDALQEEFYSARGLTALGNVFITTPADRALILG